MLAKITGCAALRTHYTIYYQLRSLGEKFFLEISFFKDSAARYILLENVNNLVLGA